MHARSSIESAVSRTGWALRALNLPGLRARGVHENERWTTNAANSARYCKEYGIEQTSAPSNPSNLPPPPAVAGAAPHTRSGRSPLHSGAHYLNPITDSALYILSCATNASVCKYHGANRGAQLSSSTTRPHLSRKSTSGPPATLAHMPAHPAQSLNHTRRATLPSKRTSQPAQGTAPCRCMWAWRKYPSTPLKNMRPWTACETPLTDVTSAMHGTATQWPLRPLPSPQACPGRKHHNHYNKKSTSARMSQYPCKNLPLTLLPCSSRRRSAEECLVFRTLYSVFQPRFILKRLLKALIARRQPPRAPHTRSSTATSAETPRPQETPAGVRGCLLILEAAFTGAITGTMRTN